MQIAVAIIQARQQLSASESANLDAELLLCYVLGCERTYLYTYPEQELTPEDNESFNKLIALRLEGHPIAHLIQKKEFWSMDFLITPDTLIPRPETEIIVDAALKLIPKISDFSILDLGTGAGAIAIAIASERPEAIITASDINNDTLTVAKKNAKANNIYNITFKQGNWFDIKEIDSYDLIVSNPPYISVNDLHLEQDDVRFESRTALVSGEKGLDDIKKIVVNARNYLNKNGWLLIEHGYQQGEAVRDLFSENKFNNVSTINDYSALERATMGQWTA